MDYPKLWNYLAEIINPLLGDRLKLNDLKPLILQHLAPIGKAAVLFAEILLEFKKSTVSILPNFTIIVKDVCTSCNCVSCSETGFVVV